MDNTTVQSMRFCVGRTITLGLIVLGLLGGAVGVDAALAKSASGRMSIEFGGKQLCLGLQGAPGVNTETTTVSCDGAPTWTVWDKDLRESRIVYGTEIGTNQLCLDVDTHSPTEPNHVSLWWCHGTWANQGWAWPTPTGRTTPKGSVYLTSSSAPQDCLAPSDEGEQVFVAPCNVRTQTWTMIAALPTPTLSKEFKAGGTFTAPKTATYRVLGIGGGGGGSFDEGGGGGSGKVAYKAVSLTKDDSVTVTVGAGGAGGIDGTDSEKKGTDGEATTFGTHLTAAGGKSGQGSNQPGGNGGSGGSGDPNSSGASQTGGKDGGAGTSSGAGAGTGEGPSFSSHFPKITSYDLSAGAGGTTDPTNGSGGGGGGGIVVGGVTSVGGKPNAAGTARGGVGYGAGGGGGNGTGAQANRNGGNGEGGLLIVEWD